MECRVLYMVFEEFGFEFVVIDYEPGEGMIGVLQSVSAAEEG